MAFSNEIEPNHIYARYVYGSLSDTVSFYDVESEFDEKYQRQITSHETINHLHALITTHFPHLRLDDGTATFAQIIATVTEFIVKFIDYDGILFVQNMKFL